jgi:hypothetical protein
MAILWILMGIGLSVLKGGFGRCSACWIGDGHGWKWSNSHHASHRERFELAMGTVEAVE